MIDRKTELLAPAGDMERLEMALHYGADAVYLAGKRFGMRASAGNFSMEELAVACAKAHEKGAAVHLTAIPCRVRTSLKLCRIFFARRRVPEWTPL